MFKSFNLIIASMLLLSGCSWTAEYDAQMDAEMNKNHQLKEEASGLKQEISATQNELDAIKEQ